MEPSGGQVATTRRGYKDGGLGKLPILQVRAVPLVDSRVDEFHARHSTKPSHVSKYNNI